MKIGLVLRSTPAYSETFFNSKIKGLQKNGRKFRQKKNRENRISNFKNQNILLFKNMENENNICCAKLFLKSL